VQPRDDGFESRASLFQQNAPLSDPCTFRLIAKNVTNLLRDTGAEASQKAAALTSLDALLRCATSDTVSRVHVALVKALHVTVELGNFSCIMTQCRWPRGAATRRCRREACLLLPNLQVVSDAGRSVGARSRWGREGVCEGQSGA